MDKFEVVKKIHDDREKIVSIIVQLVDERISKMIKSGDLFNWILEQNKKGNEFKIQISPDEGIYLWDIKFTRLIDEMCFKKYLGFIKVPVRFKDTDLRELIRRITYFEIEGYSSLVVDVLNISKKFTELIQLLENKGYKVNLDYNVTGKNGCIVTIE